MTKTFVSFTEDTVKLSAAYFGALLLKKAEKRKLQHFFIKNDILSALSVTVMYKNDGGTHVYGAELVAAVPFITSSAASSKRKDRFPPAFKRSIVSVQQPSDRRVRSPPGPFHLPRSWLLCLTDTE